VDIIYTVKKMKVKNIKIGKIPISTMGLGESADFVLKKAEYGEGLMLCCCSLNDLMMADKDKEFRGALAKADICTADGMPLVWYMRYKNGSGERVYGPDLMNRILESNESVLKKQMFIGDKKNKYFFEKIGKYIELPYKNVFNENDYQMIIRKIRKNGTKVVWIGLGSKKQVIVASELYKRMDSCVYLTVGAAFDFLSGNKIQCPKLIRNLGGEWLFRWFSEPKRLTGRYISIIKFVFRSSLKYISGKK